MKNSLKYILLILLIIIPCSVAILIYNDKIAQDSPKYYAKGVSLYESGDYQNAYYVFGKIKWISPLYHMALFKQAKSAQKVGDYSTAALKYKLFLEKNQDSIFAKSARFNLAKCNYYLKNYDEAKILFEESKSKNGNKASIDDYYLGLIYKKENKEIAAKHLIDYLNADSIDNKSYEFYAAEELSAIGKDLSEEEKILLGKIYYKNNKYSKALDYFSKVSMDKVWDYFVLSNHYAGNKVIAKKLIERGISQYCYSIDKNNLQKIYDIYASYMRGTKIKNWSQILVFVQENALNGEDYVLYKLAGISTKEKALAMYEKIIENYIDSDYAPESIWNVFWNEYSKKNYTRAKELAYKHLKTYEKVNSTTRMAFWLYKILEKEGKQQEAHNILVRLSSKYPDDYYGLRAEAILDKKNDFWKTNPSDKLPENNQNIEFPITVSEMNIKDIKLINSMFEMGDYEVWLDADFDNKIVESWFELRKNKRVRSIVLARDTINDMSPKPSLYSAAYKLAYPLYYTDELNIAGEKLNLDPYYIISLIKEESHFDEKARSSTNATGLMQIMPATANYIISKLKMDIPALADIENPKTNIYLGTNYLRYLEDIFQDTLLVTAAYNGGEGSVRKWIKTYGYEDKDEFIENIQFEETRNYVKKVFRTYHMYKKIYN